MEAQRLFRWLKPGLQLQELVWTGGLWGRTLAGRHLNQWVDRDAARTTTQRSEIGDQPIG